MDRRFYKISILGVAVVLLFIGCATTQQTVSKGEVTQTPEVTGNLDKALTNLTTQIVSSMTEGGKKKVAVIEFSDIRGNITDFGKYLAEELITRLFRTGKFEVIERQLLNKVVSEQKLSLTGFIDPGSAKQLGRILGVDAIVSGTITDLGTSLKVNARIISTETGAVFAVAATEIKKDATVRKLMKQVSVVQRPKEKVTEEAEEKPIERKVSGEGGVFFKEEFSEVEEGMVPKDWLGCEHLMVKEEKRTGRKYLTPFEGGPRKITIPNVKFPSNFRLDIIGKFNFGIASAMTINVGNLRTVVGYYGTSLGNTSGGGLGACTITKVSIVKQGSIFKLYVEDAQRIMIRHPDFEPPSSITIDNNLSFELYQIIGTDLGEEKK